jgi:adenylate kinase family enzyme
MESIYRIIEPCVINIRKGNNGDLQDLITKNLSGEHDFVNLDVKKLQAGEIERGTNIGNEIARLIKLDHNLPSSIIVKMLNKIIYCGQANLKNFILSNFPNDIDGIGQVQALE